MRGGNGFSKFLPFSRPPTRVVSLVPSMTESFFDLGLGDRIVGVTDFCRPPADAGQIVRVGGTKSPSLERILALNPDLVVANQEENTRQAVEELEAAGLKVWVSFPRSVDDALQVLWALVRLFQTDRGAAQLKTLEATLAWTEQASLHREPTPFFCPIWREPRVGEGTWWMTFNRDTYAHDLLARCGGLNVFAKRERRYPLAADLNETVAEDPGERDTRYPRVTLVEVIDAAPEVILLPDEPYAFSGEEVAQLKDHLADTPAVKEGRLHLVDGSLITWHGTRLARALAEIPAYLQIG